MKGLILLLSLLITCTLEVKMAIISNNAQEDILKIVPDERLRELRDFFKVDWPSHANIHNFIDTAIKIKMKDKKFENYISIYAPNGNWSDGTIIGIIQMGCYDLVLYSFDKTFSRLKQALRDTKVIDWGQRIVFPAVKNEFVQTFRDFKNDISRPFIDEFHADTWRLPKEKALDFTWSIPEDYYLAAVNASHIDTIFTKMSRRRIYSKEFKLKNLEATGGIGLFSKVSNGLRAWILKNNLGAMASLEVDKNFRRKGLGSLIVKIFSKKLAEEGIDSIAYIEPTNKISQHIFEKFGFIKEDSRTWLYDTVNKINQN